MRLASSENGLQAADGPLPWPRIRDDVRGATKKSVVSRSARRLASSEATPVRLDGSENGLQAADGPLPVQRTHDDVRGTTQKSVVPRSALRLPRSARRLASSDATPAALGCS